MRVELSADQEAFIRQAIKDGRVSSTEEAIQEALQLWEKHARRSGEILAVVDEAETSLSRGEGIAMNEDSMRNLAQDVKRRERLRFFSAVQARLV
jgi:Arc/MetJ-type ribon-helix-helix transcriptional regulator